MSSEKKEQKNPEIESESIPESLEFPQAVQAKVPKEMEELVNLLSDLFQETSDLVLASMEIDERIIEEYPQLRELKESCARVARIVRKIIKLGRRLPRQPPVK
jgi:adenosyl cobinamide kinase/adenosyl cobinamide phosphate guanylyltransferase